MFLVTSADPLAASDKLRDMSDVVTDCSLGVWLGHFDRRVI